MRQRDFIKLFAGLAAGLAVASTLAARAEQPPMPVVGFLNSQSAQDYQRQLAAFREALADGGYVEGRNVTIDYRWAENHPERLPAMVADLIERKVAVIAATSTPAALAAKAANTPIPIVFETGYDPVRLGLAQTSTRPAGPSRGLPSSTRW